jgi:uncharacterized protein
MTQVESAPAGGATGDTYPRLLRTPSWRWWRPLLGLLGAAFALVLGGVVIPLVAVIVAILAGGSTDTATEDALDPDTVLGLLANNLILAAIVPAVAVAVLVVHQERVGWLASVTGRVRWGMLARLLGLALLVVVVFYGLGLLVPEPLDQGSDGTTPPTATLVGLLAVILLTTPLQAAGEEVGFRGYLTQAVSSWFARPAVGIAAGGAVSAVCFALAHGVQDPWLFGDRLAFGVVASWLACRTGGLEASVALHTANNVVSLAVSATTGTLSDSLTASSLDWQLAALDVTMMVVFALLVDRLVRRRPPATRRVLSATGAVGYPEQRPPTPPPAGRENPWGMG